MTRIGGEEVLKLLEIEAKIKTKQPKCLKGVGSINYLYCKLPSVCLHHLHHDKLGM